MTASVLAAWSAGLLALSVIEGLAFNEAPGLVRHVALGSVGLMVLVAAFVVL